MMISGHVLRAWKTVKPHVPLIKFRKGGNTRGPGHSEKSGPGGVNNPKLGKLNVKTGSRPVLEDWQLPPQYRRLSLDEKEIQSINSGGAF